MAVVVRPPIGVQRKMMELGRIRLGDKKGAGRDKRRKLSKFRLTSASRVLLEKAAEVYGGTVQTWDDAEDDGWFELYTETDTLDIVLPPVFSDRDGQPTLPYSQAYEQWTGGGCVRRCDGVTEAISNKPCMCDPENRECEIRTRLSVMLPKIPGLGVWILSTKGWNAATMIPATLDLLMHAASERRFIEAVLRLEQRTSKKDGVTMKFVVPVIDLPGFKLEDALAPGGAFAAINAPVSAPREKPALPVAPPPPVDNGFDNGQPGFGQPPALPTLTEPDAGGPTPETNTDSSAVSPDRGAVGASGSASVDRSVLTKPQSKKLDVLVTKLRAGGHTTTAKLWKGVAAIRGMEPAALVAELGGRDAEGALHWAPLRESLSRDEAGEVIDSLEAQLARAEADAASEFRIPPGAQAELGDAA